ncbi:SDR family NAD(P)-dependent oxidoreductase [Nocardia jiangsuensis]|uniref:SDR family NAD(P)-dependent oxidoreductase n=1 Tax=Nocardia jiangsuensis TaxID=1691563 RepID=A0ABV8DP42_9NOCA
MPEVKEFDGAWRDLADRSVAEQRRMLSDFVCRIVADVIGETGPESIDPSDSFQDLGFDSRMAIGLRDVLTAETGVALTGAVAFDYPTINRLAEYLRTRLSGEGGAAEPLFPISDGAVDNEPIAIVGMSCRLPGGVSSPEQLWDIVADGRDVIAEFPTDRGWPDDLYDPEPGLPGKTYARTGGFVYDAPEFDAAFFGIGPKEATAMDPQQRLMLEGCWEALEHAGIDPTSLRGSRTGVYTGLFHHDYHEDGTPPELAGYLMTGITGSVASGRVSYVLGLTGPALTVDTACSSSLVTVHLAVQALRGGECDMALAGGVTVMAKTNAFTSFSMQRGLSDTGRCSSYATGANGTVWAEGIAMLVLEPLSLARRNGHRVLALVRGSAVNQDGASNGLAAPNGPAQQQVIRDALGDAGLTVSDIDAVEGHGTGTVLGDPIEVQALLSTYGRNRPAEAPLWLGSIKSNMGHTQGAAGAAGLIKLVEAMRHETLPRTLHVDGPTEHVDWSEGNVRLLTEPVPWPRGERPRRAAVSAFGISGTNAHVIVQEPPLDEQPAAERTAPPQTPWILSGKTEAALSDAAARLARHLRDNPEADATDVGFTLATARAEFDSRAVVFGPDLTALTSALDALATGDETPSAVRGVAVRGVRTALLFPGQGAQKVGMAAQLYRSYAVFATTVDELCWQFDKHLDTPLRSVIFAEPGTDTAALLDQTAYTQAALFVVEVALYRLLRSWGVTTDFLIGHSIGELAAAYSAGVWSTADACTLVAARGRLMQALPAGGAMVSVAAAETTVRELIAGREDRVGIAAVNGPRSVVVSGDADGVDEIVAVLTERGVKTKRLTVSHAFHSPRMEPMLAEFGAICAGLTYHRPTVTIVSTLTGKPVDGDELGTPEYWVRQVRQPVRFMAGAQWLLQQEHVTTFLEAGPGATLTALVRESCTDADPDALTAVAALRARDGNELGALFGALGSWYCAGGVVDWTTQFLGTGACRTDLPTYPFQRERYWIDGFGGTNVRESGLDSAEHPLLGAVVWMPDSEDVVCTGRLSLRTDPWLADHEIGGVVLFPGTAYLELALHLGTLLDCPALSELVLRAPLTVPAVGGVELRVLAGTPDEGGARAFSVYSRLQADASAESEPAAWACHATGVIAPHGTGSPAPASDLTDWPPAGATAVNVADAYDDLAELGYGYGPIFRGLTALWRRGAEAFAEVELPDRAQPAAHEFGIHPALLDAALHTIGLSGLSPATSPGAVTVPFSWEGVALHTVGASSLRVRLTPAPDDEPGSGRFALTLADGNGTPVGEVAALTLREISAASLGGARPAAGSPLYGLTWTPVVPVESVPLDDPWTADGDIEHVTVAARSVAVLRFEVGPPAEDVLPTALRERVTGLLTRLQKLLAEDGTIVVVTRHGVAVHAGEELDLVAAAAWGLLRTAQNENRDRVVIVDVDSWDDYRAPVEQAVAIGSEPQLAARRGALFGGRLTRSSADNVGAIELLDAPTWRLTPLGKGTLTSDNLALVEDPDAAAPLRSGEVRVALRATGVNFRDVLIVLGMYPDPDAAIGGEGAGVVLEVAPDVTEFVPGDRVFGFVTGVGSASVTDQRYLARMPRGWSFAQAAAVPVVFGTAYFGLVDLAGVQPGETLLLHAATGGVGMAAVQLARHLRLQLLVTASRPKWDVLREMGFDDSRIGDSRSLDFEQKFMAVTDGRGVDVVLDSLAGEFVDASLRLLPRGGRFIEMGMTDRRDPAEVAADHAGVMYRAFHLMEAGPDRLHEIMTTLVELFDSGVLRPLPITGWDMRQVPEAFRFLGQARHIGKNVLTVPTPLNTAGTVLVTGGTGGLGALAARHLARTHGVRNLVLASRRGPAADGARELRAELQALGAEVDIVACDVADRAALDDLLAAIPADHPLTGVVHTAGVLADGLLTSMTPGQLATVLRPKVDAAWNLHAATKHLDLSAFVLYSSIAGVTGGPGQANYAAANVFLDALAQHRHLAGLPATSVAWGAWRQSSGMTSTLTEADFARMRREGFSPLGDDEGMALFDAALAAGTAGAVAARIDTAVISTLDPEGLPSVMRGLLRSSRQSADSRAGESSKLVAQLTGRSAAEQNQLIVEVIRGHAATVLGHESSSAVDPEKPFSDIGFDSLGVMEFRNRLRSAVGVKLSTTVVFDYPTPIALADFIRSEIAPADNPAVRIMAEVESLARSFSGVELDSEDRADIAARLAAVLRELTASAASGGESADAAGSLDSADDSALFEFIDQL